MLFERSQSEKAVLAAIERGSRTLTQQMVVDLISVSTTLWKPSGYDAHVTSVRLRYEGRSKAIHRAARGLRYPTTSKHMPDVTFNWTKLQAELDAAVYDYEPDRFLVGDDGQVVQPRPNRIAIRDRARIDDEDPSAVAFADLVRDAKLSTVMPELERRTMAARTMFARVVWHPDFDEEGAGCPAVDLYWPSDVYVIPHASRPTSLRTAVALVARMGGPNGVAALAPGGGEAGPGFVPIAGVQFADETWFEAWTRPCEENGDGSIKSFGPWACELVNLRGDRYLPFGSPDAKSPMKRLPWAVLHAGIPAGCPYVDEDRDVVDVTDALNVGWSNIFFVSDMQGHDQPVITGHSIEAETIAVGPDKPMKLGPGQEASLLSPNPKLEEMLNISRTAMRTLALTRRQSPDAYATEPGPPLTGVSRKIANEPQDKARREREHVAKAFEQEDLLPILIEHGTTFGHYAIAAGLKPRMTPKDPPDFEDAEAKQRRVIEAQDTDWIERARAATEAGWYRSEADAREALEKIEKDKPEPSALPIAPNVAALAAAAQGKPPDDEDEEEPEPPPPKR